MNCSACHTPNPTSSRFCNRCGASLATAVPPAMAASPAGPHAPPPWSPPAAASAANAAPPIAAAAPALPVAGAAGLVARITGITLKPKDEWPVIAAEPPSLARVVVGCVLPLAAIQAVLSFVHMAVIGVSVPFAGSVRMPVAASLMSAVMGFVFAIVGCFVAALIVNGWAAFFGGRRDLGEALKVAAYTAVPAWIGAFFGILPWIGTLIGLVAALYAIYVLWLGLPVVMRAPRERATGYTVAVILTGIVLGIVLGVAMAMLGRVGGWGGPGALGGGGPFGMGRPSAELRDAQAGAAAGNILGNVLGTDAQGKAALGQAIGNLARAGREIEANQAATVAAANPVATPTAPSPSATMAPPNANDMANAGAAVGGLLNALGGALGGPNRATPVDFRTLGEMLPGSLAGLPRGPVEGSNQQAMGVQGSSANARYGGGNGAPRIDLKIADAAGLSGLMGIADKLGATTDAQTADGFERDLMVGGRRVHEKYGNSSRHGEISVLVAQRFTVELDSTGLDMPALEQALGQVDIGRLEAMKDAGRK